MKLPQFKHLFAAALSAAALAGSGAAQADSITFDAVSDTATFLYGATVDGANLCAEVSYELVSWGGSSAIFHVSATNCSTGAGSGLNPNRLVSFGVGVINPDLLSASVPGVTEWDATINTNFPGFGTVELCNYAGSTCSGGASLGVYMGATDVFDLTLNFSSPVGNEFPITFSSPFPSKWQSVGISGNSVEIDGCLKGSTCTTNQVPEPGTLVLLSLAAIGAGAVRRRRKA